MAVSRYGIRRKCSGYAALFLGLACWTSGQNFDLVYDRCARWHHSAMLRGTSVFLDGGVELYQDNRTKWLGFSKYIYEVDMSESWDANTNYTASRIGRYSDNSTDANPPNMVRGGLFAAMSESNRLFTFGGSTFLANQTDPDWKPPSQDPTSLWSYDTEVRNWESYDITGAVPWRPNWGAQAEDVKRSVGFFLNGQYDRGSSYGLYTSVEYKGGVATNSTWNQIQYLGGLIMIDLHTQDTKNLSTVTLGSPRVASGLVHAPGFGKTKNGTLMAFGGMTSSGTGTDTFTNGNLIDFTIISLCDTFRDDNVTWVNQTTTGDIPTPRLDFCVCPGQKAAKDNSSYNFYIHGGLDPRTSTLYDDVHVLSIPSFTWTRVYNGTPGAGRFGHTCNSAGKRQMMSTGGARDASLFAVETTGAIPDLNATSCDPGEGVLLFDMTDLTWGSFFNFSAEPYRVPAPVVDAIGGTPDGGAAVTQPRGGWDSPAVYEMFHPPPPPPPPPPPTPTATPNTVASGSGTPSGKSIGGGAIAGAVVGSVAGAVAVAGLAAWLFRRRRRRRRERRDGRRGEGLDVKPPAELPVQGAEVHEVAPLTLNNEPQELHGDEPERHELAATVEMKKKAGESGREEEEGQTREKEKVRRKSVLSEDTR